MREKKPHRSGSVPGAKDQTRALSPDAGQVFSTFVRNLEQIGKATRLRAIRPKGRSS